jgi:CDP-Glycerol:Poly(glycerophosphate) glycerophosphotransferase
MRSKIIISIPLVWGIRNFILTGITQELERRFEIFYAIPEIGKAYMVRSGISVEQLIILKSQKYTALQRWCSLILHKSHRKRFPTASDEVFKPLIEPAKQGLRSYLVDSAALIFRWLFFYKLLERFEQFLYMQRIDTELEAQVKSIHPVFAISTSYVVNTEWSLFRLLHARKIKIITHILSFDNLTSRGYLPIKIFDNFLVWNVKMARELKAIYAIPDSKITITGTPQFDFHTHPQYLKSREWTQAQLGIEGGDYILYCANHYALTPDEPQLVKQIITALKGNPVLSSYQVVLRLHPMDDYERWNNLLADFPSVQVSYPWAHHDGQNLFWGEPSTEDLVLFSNTLRYCSLVLNIASTISIDAAILDKPVVCVGFSSDASNSFNSLYHNFHYSDHYASIMKTGATPLSVDLESLIKLSIQALKHPHQLATKRKQMVELLCGITDGRSSERIVKFILSNA